MQYGQTQDKPQPNAVHATIGRTALTSGKLPAAAHAHYVYVGGMRLGERDVELLEGVARFGSMRTDQIRELYFHGLKSRSSCGEVLKRLTDGGMLSSVPIRMPSNKTGGSPMGCYQIGKASWKSLHGEKSSFKPVRDQYKLLHTLMVVDTFILAKRLERDGVLEITDYQVEAEAVMQMAGVILKPDLRLDIDYPATGEDYPIILEVDRAKEFESQIIDKLMRYLHVYNSDEYPGKKFPQVVFVARSDDRIRNLRRYISKVTPPDGLFTVVKLNDLPQLLM